MVENGLTLVEKIEDKNKPENANVPPTKVVIRIPILSVRIPATGDSKNVVPIVNDPTSAAK